MTIWNQFRRKSPLESRLERARQQLKETDLGRTKEQRALWRAAHEEVLESERQLAISRSEEYAIPCDDLGLRYEPNAPSPHLFSNELRTVLVVGLHLREVWAPLIEDLSDPSGENQAIIEFHGCRSARLNGVNDEAINGHPLYGRGLATYQPHYVGNSRWIKELQSIHSVHPAYDPARWKDLKHYLLCFHDDMFECIARSHTVEKTSASWTEIVQKAMKTLGSTHV
jgi:hypothetical protein